jgi:hypothetical protein
MAGDNGNQQTEAKEKQTWAVEVTKPFIILTLDDNGDLIVKGSTDFPSRVMYFGMLDLAKRSADDICPDRRTPRVSSITDVRGMNLDNLLRGRKQ